MTEDELMRELGIGQRSPLTPIPESREGAVAHRLLPDGRDLTIYPMTFGKYRLFLSQSVEAAFTEDGW